MASPTQRTLEALKKQGFTSQVVEKWNPFAKIRQDLFGFIDIVSIHPTLGIIGIQCTSGSHHSNRKEKILASEKALEWLIAGGKIEVWSWRQLKVERGKKAKRWDARIEQITTDHFLAIHKVDLEKSVII